MRWKAELVGHYAALSYLLRKNFVGEADVPPVKNLLLVLPDIPEDHQVTHPWRAAREALATDAEAPLPS